MNETNKNIFLKIRSELEGFNGVHTEIPITITEDGTPMAVAFFDIDKTLAELKNIHGKAVNLLFKEVLGREIEGIEDVYFAGFKLGNSFREFDRMDQIFDKRNYDWIDPNIYIKERLNLKKKEIDSLGTEEHERAQMYLSKYVEIASGIADDIYKNNSNEFESSKIKPVFALAKFYKALGIPMFGMTANGKKFVHTISKYLGLSELFLDIATDEDMVGGGKEVVIPKLINYLENKGIKVSKEKLVIVGDSLSGDIGSGYRYKDEKGEIFIKGILVLKDMDELETIRRELSANSELAHIIKSTSTEAFVLEKVKLDNNGNPNIFTNKNNFLIKL